MQLVTFGIFFLTLLVQWTVRSDSCDVILISGTSDGDISGQYHEGDDCGMFDWYQHRQQHIYLYYTNNWWVVDNQPCNPKGIDDGYIRVKDSAHSPEQIRGDWEERNGSDIWITNPSIKADCHYYDDDPHYDDDDDDNVDDDEIWMIVGITIGVIGITVAIVLSIIYCPRKMKAVKPGQTRVEVPPTNLPVAAYYTGGSNNVAFMPGSMPIGVQNQVPPTNQWAASQLPMAQVQVPSYDQAISTEKSPLPDGYGQHVQGQMMFGVPGNGVNNQ